jgi:hypothetical protein
MTKLEKLEKALESAEWNAAKAESAERKALAAEEKAAELALSGIARARLARSKAEAAWTQKNAANAKVEVIAKALRLFAEE